MIHLQTILPIIYGLSTQDVINIAQILAGFAAAIALIITYFTFRNFGKSEETKLAESVFKDIRTLEGEKYNLPAPQPIHEDKYKDWASLFFNTLEWLSFLINTNKINDSQIIGFFKPAIVGWYDIIFLDKYYITEDQVNNEKEYKEFKKLIKELKSGRFRSL
jgi:hypothetical protein